MSEHREPHDRSSGILRGDVLARVALGGDQELQVVRQPDGLLALTSTSNAMTIGTVRDVDHLISALQALSRALGSEGERL